MNVLRPETGREMPGISGRGMAFQSGRFSYYVSEAKSGFFQLGIQRLGLKTIYCIFQSDSAVPAI